MTDNQAILDWIDSIGGGSVWEPEVFAVTLIDVDVDDEQALQLCGLSGVEQIAINAKGLSAATLQALARIDGLKSLVLKNPSITDANLIAPNAIGLRTEIVSD
jgi:hypothetical protein